MPHTFDLSWDDLQSYSGVNPKPADHAAYWEQAVAEIAAVDPQVELTKADFESPFADCFHLHFTGIGGARVYAQLVRPKGQTVPGPAVVMFHGYAWHSADWVDKLAYAAAGITVVAMDCRGQGGRSVDASAVIGNTLHGHIIRGLADALAGRPEKLLFRQIFADTAQITQLVMEYGDG